MRFPWKNTGIATLAVIAATVARIALGPFLAFHLPYVTYFVAVVFIAWRTSTRVALASALACWLAAVVFFMPARFGIADWIGSLAYFTVVGAIVFIADRMRHAQEQSARSERQLELISNRLPALVSYIDRDRRYVWCNDEYTRWFGLTREQVIGRRVEEVLGEDVWRSIGPRIDAALAGQFVDYESEARYAHGGNRWIHVTYTPHLGEGGDVAGLVAMVMDISARKRAEQNNSLLAGLNQAFASQGSVRDAAQQVSERLVELLGLSRCLLAEIDEDANSVRVIHQHPAEPNLDPAAEYRVSDFLTYEEQSRLSSGKPLVINDVSEGRDPKAAARYRALGVGAVVSAPYVSEGKRKFALAAEKSEPYAWRQDEIDLLCEVSARIYGQFDRARAEQTLRESEHRYRSLAAVLTDIPCNVDSVGRFVTPQDAWSRYTGQDRDQYCDFGWLDAVHPEDREPARLAWRESLRTNSEYEVRVRIWHAATRRFRHVIARATPLFDESGTRREWVGACTDIHDETEQAQALIEADRRKDEFLATLAHELRNPLAPIRNSLYILKVTGQTEGAVANVYQMLERQVKHLIRLVDDLMEVSRITRGRIELRMERTDVEAVMRSAIEASRPLIDQAGHALDVSFPKERLSLEGDPVRLAQVVTNLLNNSAKYTDRGGHIWLAAWREGDSAVISVRDNGCGISAEMLPRVFDLFTQAGGKQGHPQGGLGIGLTLVRSLVDLHGGSVAAGSDGPGRGSEFIVRLPLGAVPEEVAPQEGDNSVTSRRVLIVDDNRDAATSLGVLLTLHGVETRTAYNGREALEVLDEFKPAVILLDLGMPGMDGCELARRVRQHPHGRHVTLVALTGWGHARDRERSASAGIKHHLVKPVDLDMLRNLLADTPENPPGAATEQIPAERT